VKPWQTCALGLLTGCSGDMFGLGGLDASSSQTQARAHPIIDGNRDPWSGDAGSPVVDDGDRAAHDGGQADPDVGTQLYLSPNVAPVARGRDAMLANDRLADHDSGDSSDIAVGPVDGSTNESGAFDATPDGSAFVGSLSHIGTADFHISFTFTTTQIADTALVNQRTYCTFGLFWDIRVVKGALLIETCDGYFNYTAITTRGPLVNDKKPHRVIVQRVAQKIIAYIDGVASGTADSKSAFDELPPVSSKDPCETVDQLNPFLGSIANLSVTSP
jgi:hypothetical protein